MYMQIFTNLYYNVFLDGFERYVGLKVKNVNILIVSKYFKYQSGKQIDLVWTLLNILELCYT